MADDGFPAIADYGIIGDGRTLALVSRAGAIEWLCLPDLDSASVFASMLDRKVGGCFEVHCPGGHAVRRQYRAGTNILETEFESPDGRFLLVDFMTINAAGAFGLEPERELIRIIEPLSGRPEVEVRYHPAPDYARAKVRLEQRGKLGWVVTGMTALLLLRSSFALHDTGGILVGRTRLENRTPQMLSLSYARRDPAVIPMLGDRALERLATAQAWWRGWSAACCYTGPYKDLVLRSALVLKLLQFNLSGAIAAAATTSLPEALDGGRNWDYRYCWLRDSAFMLRAFVDLGFWNEGAAFFGWLMHSTRLTQPRLMPLYDVYGCNDLDEFECPHLSGYRGVGPVRIGNAAATQFQLDVYGALVSAARVFIDRGHTLDRVERHLLVGLGREICKAWRAPDNGIWEFRGERRHHTYSKVMAWSVLNDLLSLAGEGHFRRLPERFAVERDAIHKAVMDNAVGGSPKRFKGAFDKDYLDAALLLLPRVGFVSATDPVMEATWDAIKTELTSGAMVHRYGFGSDSLEGHEGAFVICGFWSVEYLARAGKLAEAKERFAALISTANDLGLLAEEYDTGTYEMLGNFPQAFSHSGLISAALAIMEAENGQMGRAA